MPKGNKELEKLVDDADEMDEEDEANEVNEDADADIKDSKSDANSNQTTQTHRGRRTHLHCLAIQRNLGIKKTIKFNQDGQPIGDVATQMQSYIGVLARDKVKITYDSWDDVPPEIKEQIWEAVNLNFNVDPRWKSGCMSSASSKFRGFKARLTTNYVYKRLNSPDLNTPPSEYPFIKSAVWKDFVISRLTDKFKNLREQQQRRRAQYNDNEYRLSRKGYARYASEHPEIYHANPEIRQAKVWIAGRTPKDGKLGKPEFTEKVSKIEDLITKKESGELQEKGTVLEVALEKEEHRGRLRGVGEYVTPKAYFNVPRGMSRIAAEQEKALMAAAKKETEREKKEAERDARIAKLEAAVYKQGSQSIPFEETKSYSVDLKRSSEDEIQFQMEDHLDKDDVEMVHKDDEVQMVDANAHFMDKLVALRIGSGTNNIARFGTVVKVLGPKEEMLCVSIVSVVDENAPLPIPTTECSSIGEAVGSHVSWPIHLVKLHEKMPTKKLKIENDKILVDVSTLPKKLCMVFCISNATREAKKGCITIPLVDGIFPKEHNLYLNFEDIEPFCKLEPISYTCIIVYIWHLYKELRRLEKGSKYIFVDPFDIGHIPYTKGSKKSTKDCVDERANNLAAGLSHISPDQFALAPCNVGGHWILTIIDPHREKIGLLDPLHKGINDTVWKDVVNLAINSTWQEIGE